jgi:uncharacterized membrane protein YhaH (DUF805 family)
MGSDTFFKPLKRGMYFALFISSMFLFVGVGLLIDSLIWGTQEGQPKPFMVVTQISWYVFAIYITIRRLRDLDMSLLWLVAVFVPVLNLYLAVKLLFFPSVAKAET